MARRTTDFQTIHSEGGLLPPDLLRRVLDPKASIDDTFHEPMSYTLVFKDFTGSRSVCSFAPKLAARNEALVFLFSG